MSNKRYFLLQPGIWGGELIMGTVTEEFVEYWKDKDEDELIEHLQNCDWGDEEEIDKDSPHILESDIEDGYRTPYTEIDDLGHIYNASDTSEISVVEIKLKDGVILNENGELEFTGDQTDGDNDYLYQGDLYTEIGEEQWLSEWGYHGAYCRECYMQDEQESEENTPMLTYIGEEKGRFGAMIVETNGEDFIPEKLEAATVESDLISLFEKFWYDGKVLYQNFDETEPNPKGSRALVGYKTSYYDSEDAFEDFIPELYDENEAA